MGNQISPLADGKLDVTPLPSLDVEVTGIHDIVWDTQAQYFREGKDWVKNMLKMGGTEITQYFPKLDQALVDVSLSGADPMLTAVTTFAIPGVDGLIRFWLYRYQNGAPQRQGPQAALSGTISVKCSREGMRTDKDGNIFTTNLRLGEIVVKTYGDLFEAIQVFVELIQLDAIRRGELKGTFDVDRWNKLIEWHNAV